MLVQQHSQWSASAVHVVPLVKDRTSWASARASLRSGSFGSLAGQATSSLSLSLARPVSSSRATLAAWLRICGSDLGRNHNLITSPANKPETYNGMEGRNLYSTQEKKLNHDKSGICEKRIQSQVMKSHILKTAHCTQEIHTPKKS